VQFAQASRTAAPDGTGPRSRAPLALGAIVASRVPQVSGRTLGSQVKRRGTYKSAGVRPVRLAMRASYADRLLRHRETRKRNRASGHVGACDGLPLDFPAEPKKGGHYAARLGGWPATHAAWKVTLRNSAEASRCSRRSGIVFSLNFDSERHNGNVPFGPAVQKGNGHGVGPLSRPSRCGSSPIVRTHCHHKKMQEERWVSSTFARANWARPP